MPISETQIDGRERVPVRDDRGQKRPFNEFYEEARSAGLSHHEMAKHIHESRSRRARIADRSFKAVNYYTAGEMDDRSRVREYYAQPNRVDVSGVDTTAREYQKRRVDRVKDAFLDRGIVSFVTEDEDLGPSGKYHTGGNFISMAPQAGKSTLAHELGHALDRDLTKSFVINEDSRWFGFSADAAGEEAGFEVGGKRPEGGPPKEPDEDQPFHRDIHEASESRRGSIRPEAPSGDYRTEATEKFADWFALAVEDPRHTRATRGTPWDALEERINEQADERVEKHRRAVANPVRQAVRETFQDVTTEVEVDWSHRDDRWEEAGDKRKRAMAEIDERLDEQWDDDLDREMRSRRGGEFSAQRPEDFANRPASHDELKEPFEQRIGLDELVPRETMEEYGDLFGVEMPDVDLEEYT